MINIIDSGVIFQNPLPTVQPLQTRFPGFCRLSDSEIICVQNRGPAPLAIENEYALSRSKDGGKTWKDEGPLWDRNRDDRPYSYGYGYPVRLEDGEILLAGYRWDRSDCDEDLNIYDPQTLGAVPCQTILFRSSDGGHSWGPPEVVPVPEGIAMANASGRVVPLKDGRLLLPIETWKAWGDAGPIKQRSMVLFSADWGRTWDGQATTAMDKNYRLIYWNGMFSRLDDGRILAMYWVKDTETEGDLTIRATYSQDEGQNWVEPYETGIIGQMGCHTDVGRGRVLAIYNRRDSVKPGIWAVISTDGGKTWPIKGHTLLWDARGRDLFGSTGDENRSKTIYDEGLMAFGKPDVIRMADGSFLAGFWCTANFVMHVRYARLIID